MRKRIPLPSQERLKELLTYNPQNGKLCWKARKDGEIKFGYHKNHGVKNAG